VDGACVGRTFLSAKPWLCVKRTFLSAQSRAGMPALHTLVPKMRVGRIAPTHTRSALKSNSTGLRTEAIKIDGACHRAAPYPTSRKRRERWGTRPMMRHYHQRQ